MSGHPRTTTLREVMNRYGIQLLAPSKQHRERMSLEFQRYHGLAQIVEVCRGERSAFYRYEHLGIYAFFSNEELHHLFPDMEAYRFAYLLADSAEIIFYQKTHGRQGWIDAYGSFGEKEDVYEWDYACRSAKAFTDLFEKPMLEELIQARKQDGWTWPLDILHNLIERENAPFRMTEVYPDLLK